MQFKHSGLNFERVQSMKFFRTALGMLLFDVIMEGLKIVGLLKDII